MKTDIISYYLLLNLEAMELCNQKYEYVIIIKSRCSHEFLWLSLSIRPYHSSLPVGFLN